MTKPPRPGKLRWTEHPITNDGIIEFTCEIYKDGVWSSIPWVVRRMPKRLLTFIGCHFEVGHRTREGLRTARFCKGLREAKRHVQDFAYEFGVE